MSDDFAALDQPRSAGELRAELDRVQDLVWYCRYRISGGLAGAPVDIRAIAHEQATRVVNTYPAAIAQLDLDDGIHVARLEGQQAALRWALSKLYDELLPFGELYDS